MNPAENPNKKRLRRSMMFLNAQKPGLIKDPYVYGPDSIMLDLEDAVAMKEKDAARFSLYHALKEINYRGGSSDLWAWRTPGISIEEDIQKLASRLGVSYDSHVTDLARCCFMVSEQY